MLMLLLLLMVMLMLMLMLVLMLMLMLTFCCHFVLVFCFRCIIISINSWYFGYVSITKHNMWMLVSYTKYVYAWCIHVFVSLFQSAYVSVYTRAPSVCLVCA